MTYICSQSTTSQNAQKLNLSLHVDSLPGPDQDLPLSNFESYLTSIKVTCPEFMDVYVRSFRDILTCLIYKIYARDGTF